MRGFVRAGVVDGEVATSYLRAGAGRPVVLLDPAGNVGRILAPALAAGFRVIVPERTYVGDAGPDGAVTDPAFSVWLRGFLDGLGFARVRLVAGPDLALAALGFAMLEPARVDRVALVAPGGVDPDEPPAGLRDRLARVDRPLLVCRLDAAPGARDRGIAEVVRFLNGEGEERESARRHTPP